MQENHPRVTVLLPFYKAGQELDAAIASIVNQSFTRWILVLVSNNGTPAALAIAQKWIQADPRIQMTEEPQQGIAFALNRGLQHCHTPFIARMDADDISHTERLKLQLEYLEENQDIDVVACQTTFASEIEGSEGFSLYTQWQNSIITSEEHARLRFIESPLAHPTVLFRTHLIERFGPYNTGNIPEDYELWLRWMDKGVQFHKIPRALFTWNDHSERLTRTHSNYSREAFIRVKCRYLALWLQREEYRHKKIIICGSSRNGRRRAEILQENGVEIYGFTDVKKRPNREVNFITLPQITEPEPWLLINFIARRGVGAAIRSHFSALGFVEGKDFILAG